MPGEIPILCVLILASSGAIAQSQTAFEVASVRTSRTNAGRPSLEFSRGGERLTATNTSVGQLIVTAYGITPLQLGPLDPIAYETYDIQAKAAQPATRPEMQRMLQALLADRFKLSIRREMRQMPSYALVVDKHGPKLTAGRDQAPWNLARIRGNEQKSGRMVFESETMPDFAFALSTLVVVGRVVMDETGLAGSYNFALNFAPPDALAQPADQSAPSIFTALREQLGLRLEPRRSPVEFLAIEHIERPSEN